MKSGPKHNQWVKENYETTVGLKPIYAINVLEASGQMISLNEQAFVFRHRGDKLYQVFGSPYRVHFPRSLGRRWRITTNKQGKVVSSRPK